MTLLVCSNMDTKCCGKCNLLLSLDNFSKNKDVYIGTCKKCRNLQKKEWRENNRKKAKIIEREIISQQIKVCYYMRHIQIAGKSLAS